MGKHQRLPKLDDTTSTFVSVFGMSDISLDYFNFAEINVYKFSVMFQAKATLWKQPIDNFYPQKAQRMLKGLEDTNDTIKCMFHVL